MENEPIKTIQVSNEIKILCHKTMAMVEMEEYLTLLNTEKDFLRNQGIIQYRKQILELIKANIDSEKSTEILNVFFDKVQLPKDKMKEAFIKAIEYTGRN